MIIMWNPFEVILPLMLLLWMCSSSSEARTLDSVRVFIVEEDAYNYLQNYLHQYNMKKGTGGKGKGENFLYNVYIYTYNIYYV